MSESHCKTPRTPAWLSWFVGRLGYGLLTAWVISLVVLSPPRRCHRTRRG